MGQAASPSLPEFSLLSKYPTCLLSTPGHSVNSQFHSIKYISDRLKQNLCTPLLNRKKKYEDIFFVALLLLGEESITYVLLQEITLKSGLSVMVYGTNTETDMPNLVVFGFVYVVYYKD